MEVPKHSGVRRVKCSGYVDDFQEICVITKGFSYADSSDQVLQQLRSITTHSSQVARPHRC